MKTKIYIYIYQRTFLRNIVNIKYPKIITNENLYKVTNQIQWTKNIKYRRLKWLAHLYRLPEDCPAKTALNEILKKTKLPQGRPPNTWIENIKKDIQELRNEFNIPTPKIYNEYYQKYKLFLHIIKIFYIGIIYFI